VDVETAKQTGRAAFGEMVAYLIWPTKTPLGYRNIPGPDGKKIIGVDPALAPIVKRIRVVCARRHLAERSGAQGQGGGPAISQERREGAVEHGSHYSARPPLYRLV
jgi:hypothetical protein